MPDPVWKNAGGDFGTKRSTNKSWKLGTQKQVNCKWQIGTILQKALQNLVDLGLKSSVVKSVRAWCARGAHVYFGICHAGSKCSTYWMEWRVFRSFTTLLVYIRNTWVGGRRAWAGEVTSLTWPIQCSACPRGILCSNPCICHQVSNFKFLGFSLFETVHVFLRDSYHCVHSYV